jgi:hypothetical protein
MVGDKPAWKLQETALPAEKIIDIVRGLALH